MSRKIEKSKTEKKKKIHRNERIRHTPFNKYIQGKVTVETRTFYSQTHTSD